MNAVDVANIIMSRINNRVNPITLYARNVYYLPSYGFTVTKNDDGQFYMIVKVYTSSNTINSDGFFDVEFYYNPQMYTNPMVENKKVKIHVSETGFIVIVHYY